MTKAIFSHPLRSTPLILLLIGALLTLSGCLKNQPSDSDIKAMAAEHFDQEFQDLFTASNVIKHNGYKQNDNHYVAELTITGTAIQSLDEYASGLMDDASLSSIEKLTKSMTIGVLKLSMPAFEAGDQIEFRRDYLFINTDNGWLLKREIKPEAANPLEF